MSQDGTECSLHQQTDLPKQVPREHRDTPYIPALGTCRSTLPASLEGEKMRISFPYWTGSQTAPPTRSGAGCQAGVAGMSLPNGCLQSPSPRRGAGDGAMRAFRLCVIAKFHKGIFVLSEYCLPHESNYWSCHGGSERKGVNSMGVVFA